MATDKNAAPIYRPAWHTGGTPASGPRPLSRLSKCEAAPTNPGQWRSARPSTSSICPLDLPDRNSGRRIASAHRPRV